MWIKICGTTSREDAELAIESGADALGFVFAPSPRRVTPAHVAGILSDLSITIETFGVFVDSSLDEIIATVLRCGLSGVQLHGSSDATVPRRLRRHFLRVSPARKLSIMCAVHYGNALHQQLLSFRDDAHVDAIVVDSRTATAVGGTGTTYDWAAARESFFASAPHLRLVAAGGLSPENVKQAIIALQPWGVDVVSGVEAAPGRKDPERVRAFIRNARAAASQMQPTPNPRGPDCGRLNRQQKESALSAIPTTEPITPSDARPRAVPGRFGAYGGRYVPETLMAALEELEHAYEQAQADPVFHAELDALLKDYAGRPTPLYFASRLTEHLGGAKIYLKREDLLHTGAHKINNCIGQGLLARRMGKRRIIAETGAGQHGVATATVCALFGMECVVYMGQEDMRRQELNVYRMRLLGAEVRGVSSGSRTLKDAINEAMRDWVTNVRTTHYLLGSVLGAHPYPTMVRDFHRVIGQETRRQILEKEGRLPAAIIACVGGGSNAIGAFFEFVPDTDVRLIGVEAGGRADTLGSHAARFLGGTPGVLQGTYSYVLQDEAGQISLTHSVSAGLDYASIGPEHAALHDSGRAEYVAASDEEALQATVALARLEGIVPALESAHAVAECMRLAPRLAKQDIVVINLSGRGDKDMGILSRELKLQGA